jgi:hypothetical protein
VFAGLALDGTAITIDDGANDRFYGKSDLMASDIISGKVRSNDESARRFMIAVNSGAGSQTASSTTTTASAPVSEPANGPRSDAPSPQHAAPATGAKTFPMEDPNPGKEPR